MIKGWFLIARFHHRVQPICSKCCRLQCSIKEHPSKSTSHTVSKALANNHPHFHLKWVVWIINILEFVIALPTLVFFHKLWSLLTSLVCCKLLAGDHRMTQLFWSSCWFGFLYPVLTWHIHEPSFSTSQHWMMGTSRGEPSYSRCCPAVLLVVSQKKKHHPKLYPNHSSAPIKSCFFDPHHIYCRYM